MIDQPSAAHTDRVGRFRVLYDEAYPRIMAYLLRRTATRADAEDVASEIFTTAWRRLDEIPTDERRLAWMFATARRTLANHYRSRDRRERLADRLRRTPPADEPAHDAVHAALDRLRPDDREILTLHAWDDLESPEIALVLGIPPSTAAVRLHRARKRLGRELARIGITMKSDGVTRTPDGVTRHAGEVTRE